MRRQLRRALGVALTVALNVGIGWGAAGLAPAPTAATATDTTTVVTESNGSGSETLAGAAKRSIEPRPDDYGGTWETDYDACARMDETVLADLGTNPDHLASTGSPWHENPNCIYMGGFGIGPANPVTTWNQTHGLWVRAFAVSDGADTLVVAMVDGEGWFWDYASKCDDCGAKQISEDLGTELGIDPAGIVVAATHAHSSPDFIGGWGFVPDWYMQQVADTIRDTIRDAVADLQPAVLEVGEERARQYNSERRDTYHSAEEQQLTWLRAVATEADSGKPHPTHPDVIATIGAYAAHPTAFGTNDGEAHPDWPGLFAGALEDRFGGIGIQLNTGLGNMSNSGLGNPVRTGEFAGLIPAVGEGITLADTDLRMTRTTWRQPATNVPLTALGYPGFFDRQFDAIPAEVRTGKSSDTAPCESASAVSVEVPAMAARIGSDFALSTGPGELFANITNTLKEKSGATVTMPLAQANDALGYMPQSIELNPVGQQGLGFFADGYFIVNYEDSYAIDRCFGDMALETTIDLLDSLS